ncbi:MAG: response regulator [Halieaceae bacterium]
MSTYDDALGKLDSLYLMTSVDRGFAIRGQLAQLEYQGEDALCLFGSPWLFWINSNCPEMRLKLDDFSPQDVQLDQLFFMSGEKRMLADLEELNEELKEARQGVEEAKAKESQLFAQMSHEMRTPLNGVVSALTLLQGQDLPKDSARLVELARGASTNLMQVSNYVLDIAKLESDSPDVTAFILEDIVGYAIDIVQPRAEEKGISLNVCLESDLKEAYLCDKSKLSQCILNLLINAIKFTDEGSVTLHVKQGKDADGVRFEVTDTGIGIDPANLEKVFQPFWTSSRLNEGQRDLGTGLGLDIVRRNIKVMGGDMGVESTQGEGSCFWFQLPLEPTAALPTLVSEGRRVAEALGGIVLLVDDNHTNLTLGKMLLESINIDVSLASSGREAIEKAQTEAYDLVLMDINMPDMDGFEATRQIRQFLDQEALPIVALTAYTTEEERAAGLESGMNDYIVKPIELDDLAQKLSQWLHSSGKKTSKLTDGSVLDDLRSQIGEDNLKSVLLKFQVEALSRLDKLQAAADSNDIASVLRESHTLGSTCESFGLMKAHDLLREIESSAKSGVIASQEDLRSTRHVVLISLADLDTPID